MHLYAYSVGMGCSGNDAYIGAMISLRFNIILCIPICFYRLLIEAAGSRVWSVSYLPFSPLTQWRSLFERQTHAQDSLHIWLAGLSIYCSLLNMLHWRVYSLLCLLCVYRSKTLSKQQQQQQAKLMNFAKKSHRWRCKKTGPKFFKGWVESAFKWINRYPLPVPSNLLSYSAASAVLPLSH